MKRTISFILCTVMISSFLCTAVFAGSSVEREKTPFDDVAPGSWYEDAVAWCFEKDYMNGISDSAFEPDGRMTRAMNNG